MDEEQMWKGYYNIIEEIKNNEPSEREIIIQSTDGGFFEKFGYLLRQKSKNDEACINVLLEPFDKSDENDAAALYCESFENTDDFPKSENFEAYPEGLQNTEDLLIEAIGINIEDLYEEILFEVCNNIGYNTCNIQSADLIDFAQEVFKIPEKLHNDILMQARAKDPPHLRLNIEIIKAENLLPKDANGFSDPFVTLYLESNNSHRYNSSVKLATLNPVWEEHFSLPIQENPKDEVLFIEVWDFDAAETVKEKVNKFLDIKGIKGLRKLMKEIAVTASTGKHDNELIGRTAITLKGIPVEGRTVWYNLEKGARTKSRGSILINLSLSAEKNKNVAIQEHKHLLKLLLIHELESSQVADFWWRGKFSEKAECIRSQHAVQSGLSNFDCALCQWHSFTLIHESHPLSFHLFCSILNVVIPHLRYYSDDSDEIRNFCEGIKRILPSIFTFLRNIRSQNLSDNSIVKTLSEILDIISKIYIIPIPNSADLFPSSLYAWLDKNEDCTIENALIEAINKATMEWLEHIKKGNQPLNENVTDEERLQFIIRIIQMIRSDLQKAVEYFDKHFYAKVNFKYSTVLYDYYDKSIVELVKSTVEDVCSHIKRISFDDDQLEQARVENFNMGTTLFELYLVLKRFVLLGKNLSSKNCLDMEHFYMWFMPGVTHWLDISVIKAVNRIQKAIELDQLKAVDDTVKYSSSAVDTLAIFYQIKIFWNQLDWPDIEGSYTFMAKIIDDICRCCVFYAKCMSRKLSASKEENEFFDVSPKWCLAINNMDYIRQSLPSFIKEFNVKEIITKLGEFRSKLEAERCSTTIENVIENTLDTERNQILELLETLAKQMAPSLKKCLAEGAEVLHESSDSMDKLLTYLENSLSTLHEYLNEVNFARVLDAIWSEVSIIMYDLIQANLDKRRPPAFFSNLRKTLNIIVLCFKAGNHWSSDVEVLVEIERILDLHASETSDLIHKYYLERLSVQRKNKSSTYGQLTIMGRFENSTLKLKILNARNLLGTDSNGLCDSFVKTYFFPSYRFVGIAPVKTNVQYKTVFPLYDEEFTINFTDDQISDPNSLILFSIKDKDLFGMTNQYIAECYITFGDLNDNEETQIHMELSRPEYSESEAILALEYRQGDKQAKDFLKKLKTKSYFGKT